ncbi:MAG TPA: heme o synthase [Polyangiaceae bacterium]|nr:heme o synthase [Polyangiaceae bacterium]
MVLPSGPLARDLSTDGSLAVAPQSEFSRTLSALIELGKPGVGGLVIATSLCGALTAPGGIGLGRLLLSLFGTSCVVASANGLNMVLERDSDRLMRRTQVRPLPTGRLSVEAALAFCVGAAIVGLVLLFAFVGPLAGWLTFAALLSYVALYTPLKRVTPLALFVGAVPGALPPLIGWASATGTLGTLGLLEFSLLYVWQLPHFLAIAIFRREEYARAGMRVLPVVHGVRRTQIEIALYSLLLVGVSLLPVGLGLAGLGYAVVALASGLGFLALATAGLSIRDERRWARRVFFASMPYLVVMLGSLAGFAAH